MPEKYMVNLSWQHGTATKITATLCLTITATLCLSITATLCLTDVNLCMIGSWLFWFSAVITVINYNQSTEVRKLYPLFQADALYKALEGEYTPHSPGQRVNSMHRQTWKGWIWF